jgi:hypothetical protein
MNYIFFLDMEFVKRCNALFGITTFLRYGGKGTTSSLNDFSFKYGVNNKSSIIASTLLSKPYNLGKFDEVPIFENIEASGF